MGESFASEIRIQDFPLWDRLAAEGAPFGFDLEITARCQNDCRHCYLNLPAGDRAARARELTLEEIEHTVEDAAALGALWCLITGGEPLLREDFPEIYMALKRKGLLVSVFTTAQVLTDDHVQLFHRYPPRDIEITVYGVTRETYERVTRRPGSFETFRRGLDRLLESGVKVRLKAMALRSNFEELPQIARFCRERTKDYFRFDPLLHLRTDGDIARNLEICGERLSSEEIVALEHTDAERFDSLKRRCNQLIMPELAHGGCGHLFHCGAGKGSFYVSYDGFFRLCSSLCHTDCTYDLRKGSLTDAWRSLVSKVRDMRSAKKEFLETCRVCPIVNLCLWCPAHAHLETGELDGAVPYFCEVAHARAAALDEAVRDKGEQVVETDPARS
jgi:radical SAM protein with 4Fe4S-binding SPASM domain